MVLLLSIGLPVVGQGDSSQLEERALARGFKSETAFEAGEIDTINLFNGNLTLALPLGPTYTSNGALEYGLTLVYNANVWDLREKPFPNVPQCGPKGRCTPAHWLRAIPNPLSNAGLGWTLSLGRLYAPHDPTGGGSDPMLSVDKQGGSGYVSSSPSGIGCGDVCSAPFPAGTEILLTADPDPGYRFVGWQGAADCADGLVTLNGDTSCTALFQPGSTTRHILTVRFDGRGSGAGSVVSSPPGIACPPTCTAEFDENARVDLSAVPAAGSQFTQWRFGSGAQCAGTDPETYVVMYSQRICEARFDEVGGSGPYTLTVTAAGPFGGTVHVGLPGQPTQGCTNTTCTYQTDGQDIVLIGDTPAACSLAPNYLEPECDSGQVVMTGDKSCTAFFPRDPSCPLAPAPVGDPVNEQAQWMYAAPDGSKHLFYDQLQPDLDDGDPNVHYSRDNSYMRLKTAGATKLLELADGSKHFFVDSGDGVEYRPSRWEDPYGNWLTIDSSSGADGGEVWTLTDSVGRVHTISFADGTLGPRVEEVSLAAFGGQRAHYDLVYEDTPIDRDCRDTDPATGTSLVVPLLVEVRLPEGGSYDFRDAVGRPRYFTECTGGETIPPPPPPSPGKWRLDVLPVGVVGNEGSIRSVNSGRILCDLLPDGTVVGTCDEEFDPSERVELEAVPMGQSIGSLWLPSSHPDCSDGEVTAQAGENRLCVSAFYCGAACKPYGSGLPNADGQISGALHGVRLPTRGQIEWSYGIYYLPQKNGPYIQGLAGVTERRHLDESGTVLGRWTYDNEPDNPPPWPPNPHPTATTTDVVSPGGDCTRHHFSGETDGERGWSYGLPLSWERMVGEDLYVSTETFVSSSAGRCSGALLRTTALEYDHDAEVAPPAISGVNDHDASKFDTNRRIRRSKTVFDDDGANWVETARSDFDGLGHYRRSVTTGSLAGGERRVSYTNYLAQTSIPTTGRWLLGLFDRQDTSEGGATIRIESAFDPLTGFLDCRRTLVGSNRGPDDVVVRFGPDERGNVASESWFGGDAQSVGTSSVCTAASTPTYRIDHTWSHGALATSGHRGVAHLTYDADIDRDTGLPSRRRDSAGVWTDFTYDREGRLLEERPRDAACTRYRYLEAIPAAPARVESDRVANRNGCTSTVLAQSEVLYDGFGRPVEERRRMPGLGWVSQLTGYDVRGWKSFVSEWGSRSSRTVFSRHDPFGRPGRITLPDGAVIDIAHSGERLTQRTQQVATSANGQTAVTTTEARDSFGRLVGMTEPAAAGGAVTTRYGYDAADRLVSVDGVGQSRRFVYDARGFLLSERHPEKGAGGNGAVLYGGFDAKGHAGWKQDGSVRLEFDYDAGERLKSIVSGGRALLELDFDGGAGAGLGKLWRATRHNRIVVPGTSAEVDLPVTETYAYLGPDGRASRRDTSWNGAIFRLGLGYDELGSIDRLGYPRCVAGCGEIAGQSRMVRYGYELGRLRSVEGWVERIDYHAVGLWKQLWHVNGLVEQRDTTPDGMTRPGRIRVLRGEGGTDDFGGYETLWDTGAYLYDGAGNIRRIGDDAFYYDTVLRLVHGEVAGRWQGYAYDVHGNLTQVVTDGVARAVAVDGATNRLSAPGSGYDDRGNLTSFWGLGATLAYDELGRLAQSRQGGRIDRAYVYTADEERLAVVEGPEEFTLTLRDLGGNALRQLERDTLGWRILVDHVFADGRLVGFVDAEGASVHTHLDHLGTPRLHTDAAGQSLERHDYFPFGEDADAGPASGSPLEFTGHERDLAATGSRVDDLDYMHARYYSPWWGRFLSVDSAPGSPAKPQSWNRYSYVQNQPVNFRDATGLYREDFHRSVTEIVALAAGFSASEADALAAATRSVDDKGSGTCPVHCGAAARFLYHFAPASQQEALSNLANRALLEAGGSVTGAAIPIGRDLHSLGDSFSHRGFGMPFGHLRAGTAPDITANDPAKALRAARAVYDRLVDINSLTGRSPLVPFEAISRELGSFLALGESTPEREAIRLRMLIRLLQKRARRRARSVHETLLLVPF